jgi:hypothetical protein
LYQFYMTDEQGLHRIRYFLGYGRVITDGFIFRGTVTLRRVLCSIQGLVFTLPIIWAELSSPLS